MKVVLDTNILSADHTFSRTEMIQLQNLCNEGKIELLIPEYVLREFETQEQEKADVAKKLILKQLKNYCYTVYGSDKKAITDIFTKIESNIETPNEKIKERIEKFIKGTNAQILKPEPNDFYETFDRYFTGEKPFTAVKARNDIPDSIIYTRVKDIKAEGLVFISNDGNLKNAVQSEGIASFSSLTDFINSDEIKKIIEIKNADNLLFEKLILLLDDEQLLNLFNENLEQRLLYKTIMDESIPDDNNEGTITGINGIYPTQFNKEEIVKHGSRLFSLPFYCEIDAYLDYYIYKADYCAFDEDRFDDSSIGDSNDHYFEAQEEYLLVCTGKIGLRFSSNMTIEEIKNSKPENLVQNLKMSFSGENIVVKEH